MDGQTISSEAILANRLDELTRKLDRVQETLEGLVRQQATREWYGTEEAAALLAKAEFTVREWCRLGRIHAEKRGSGRGKYQSWVISHEEILRVQREGLLPLGHIAREGHGSRKGR